VYGIAAFGEAAMERWESLARDLSHMTELRDRLEAGLASRFPHGEVAVNRPAGVRAPHIVNLSAEGIRSETMLHYLSAEGVFVSSGSA
jgi:cysteine desulfurase